MVLSKRHGNSKKMTDGMSPKDKLAYAITNKVNETILALEGPVSEEKAWWMNIVLKAKDGVISKYHTVKDNIADLRTRVRVGTIGSTLALNT